MPTCCSPPSASQTELSQLQGRTTRNGDPQSSRRSASAHGVGFGRLCCIIFGRGASRIDGRETTVVRRHTWRATSPESVITKYGIFAYTYIYIYICICIYITWLATSAGSLISNDRKHIPWSSRQIKLENEMHVLAQVCRKRTSCLCTC